MTTSLFQQLQRLKAPQTLALIDTKRKPSILFDPKEAASKDKRTIYDIGISGLEGLIALNPVFEHFKGTLFDESTIELERAVEQKDVNEALDINIKKFFHFLSPYVLLRPAHMCLEWLIRRFLVQEYNRNDLMALIMPYHETNVFVKVLQVMRLNSNDKVWNWLKPMQKAGRPLSKNALLNRASTEKVFFKFVCDTTTASIKDMGSNAHLLQAKINFYSSVVVGVLERVHQIEEWHISALLPSLIKGLNSTIVDFAAASYIITARLVSRTQLTPKFCQTLITRIAANKIERLHHVAVALLVHIFDSQKLVKFKFNAETLLNIIQQKWFTQILASLAKENMDLEVICKSIMQQCIEAIQNGHTEEDKFKDFMEVLLNNVQFPHNTARQIIGLFLDCYIPCSDNISSTRTLQDGDVIELDSDDDTPMLSKNFHVWYSEYLHKLEHQYPNAFDAVLKESLSNNERSTTINRSKAIKLILSHRLQISDDTACDIYETLYHHTEAIRLVAVQTLLSNLQDYQKRTQNLRILAECLIDRINDDSEKVAREILKLPTTICLDVMDCRKFVEALMKILYKVQIMPKQWAPLIVPVVKHLTDSMVVANYDINLLLLYLMPILCPIEPSPENYLIEALEVIFSSSLIENMPFLKVLNLNRANFNGKSFKKHFLNVIRSATAVPSIMKLLEGIRNTDKGDEYFMQPERMYNFLMLATAYLRPSYRADESLKIFQQISAYLKLYKHLSKQVQLFRDFVYTLTKCTNFENYCNVQWEATSLHDKCEFLFIMNVFEMVSAAVVDTQLKAEEQLEWLKLLKDLFNSIFTNVKAKVDFLSNFYVYEKQEGIKDFPALRVKAFKIFQNILKNDKNKLNLNTEEVIRICLALSSPMKIIRLQAMGTLDIAIKNQRVAKINLQLFIQLLLDRSEEIFMDEEQFPLILYALMKMKDTQVGSASFRGDAMLKDILDVLSMDRDLKQPQFIGMTMNALKHVNSENILKQFIPLCIATVRKCSQEEDSSVKLLKSPLNNIYRSVIERFDSQTIENVLTYNRQAWQLIELIFQNHQIYLSCDNILKALPRVFVETLDESTFQKIPANYKTQLMKIIVRTLAESENDAIFLAVNKLLKKCYVDCGPLVIILNDMHKSLKANTIVTRKSSQVNRTDAKQHIPINDSAWKQGVVLLEILENKKKLQNTELLIPALFDIINSCLLADEQSNVEYIKQLCLSAVLNSCQIAEDEGCDLQKAVPKTTFRMDQVVQCLRASQNPQTHRNALLLLSYCAKPFPHQVLHNIVDIFTFMGSSVVRHDDAFSFHIINDIIETIVPILVQEKAAIIPVMKVFSDIMLDVPEHRRKPLYTKLFLTLGANANLWIFLCVVFEAHIIHDEKQRLLNKKLKKTSATLAEPIAEPIAEQPTAKRVEILLELCESFTPATILETCIHLMHYLKKLPIYKDDGDKQRRSSLPDVTEFTLFDVDVRSSKQLRHYKYIIVQFLSSLTSSKEFLRKVALLSSEELAAMKSFYQKFIIKVLSYIPLANSALEKLTDHTHQKFWRVLLHHLHDVLDNAISLLSPDMFLVVVTGLMQHQLLSIRKKVIELLIGKLQQKSDFFNACDQQNFENLLKPLTDIIDDILVTDGMAENSSSTIRHNNELIYLQQTALIALKLLSKLFALQHIEEFHRILASLTKIAKHRTRISKILLATVVLTMIEISSNLKAHSLAYLPKFMPQLLAVLQDQADSLQQRPPDNVCLAIVAGIQKLIEALPLFLGPYMVDILTVLSAIEARILLKGNEKGERSTNTLQKIDGIWSKIACDVPLRVLVPSCEKAYEHFMANKDYDDIEILMKVLQKTIEHNSNRELNTMQQELTQLFKQAIEFRSLLIDEKIAFEVERIDRIEGSIISACVSWILKLSESSFRPLYHKMYKWALARTNQKESMLTHFRLSYKIAKALKSLFVLFAGDFIDDAARLLDECNFSKEENNSDSQHKHLCIQLVTAILNTLQQIFLHDNKEFVNIQRFELLMPAIVDQLENPVVWADKSLKELLMNCICHLAVDVSSDVMWKQLNYQVLLKTRTSEPEVRILAFNSCLEIARKLGDDFTPLLPETVPFIAELLEDENPYVEKSIREAVQELEGILGDSLQKYF